MIRPTAGRLARLIGRGGLVVALLVAATGLPLAAAQARIGGNPMASVPAGLTPNDPPSIVHKDVVLQWAPVDGAPSYQVQISTDPAFANNVVIDQTGIPSTSYAPPVTLPHASYYWRVRAVSSTGAPGSWSNVAAFTRGWPVSPTGLTVDPSGLFSWTAMPDASSYQVEISGSASFPAPAPVQQSNNSPTSYTCVVNHPAYALSTIAAGKPDTTPGNCFDYQSSLTAGTTYYLRVRGLDGTNATSLGTGADPGLGCAGVSYNDPTQPFPTSPSTAECSYWSAGVSFTMPGTPTGTATTVTNLAVLGCGAQNACTDTPALTWSPVAGATSYRVYLGLDPAFTNVQDVYDVATSAFIPDSSLPDNTYYVGVQACTSLSCGQLSQVQFSELSRPVGLISPLSTVVAAAYPQFVWQDFLASGGAPTQEAKTYHLQISTDPAFGSTLVNVTIDRQGETPGQAGYTPTVALPDGTLYWRVQPIDGSGNALTWSAKGVFVKDTFGPQTRITTASGVAVTGPIAVSFSEPVTGVSSGTLSLVPDGGTAAVPGTVAVQSSTGATFTPSAPLVPGQSYHLAVSTAIRDTSGRSAVVTGPSVRTATTVAPGNPALTELWSSVANANAHGGGYDESQTTGATTTLSFTGTAVTVVGMRDGSGGEAAVYLDNAYQGVVSYFSRTPQWGAVIWATSGLPAGPHTLTLRVLGQHSPGSVGNWVTIDDFQVGAATYDEASADPGGPVRESWSPMVATDATVGRADVEVGTVAAGAGLPTVSVPVVGSAVTVKLCKGPSSGYAYIGVDGARRAAVNLYQSWSGCGFVAFSTPLPPGVHTVTVSVSGVTLAPSTGTRVGFDAVTVN